MLRKITLAMLLVLVPLVGVATPRLTVDRELYEAGEVVQGVFVDHTFVLRNSGTSTLQIQSVRVNYPCCATLNPRLANTRLAPGDSTELNVRFRTAGYASRRQPIDVVTTVSAGTTQVSFTLRVYVRATEADIQHRTPTELPSDIARSPRDLSNAFYLLIDVRDQRDYRSGHLLGALNIPSTELVQRVDDLPRNKPIYVYDDTGAWSTQAVNTLRAHGIDARAIAGGLVRWQEDLGQSLFNWSNVISIPTPRGTPYSGSNAVPPLQVARNHMVILDVRSSDAFARGHLPGSVNVAPDEISAWARYLPQSRELPSGANLTVWVIDEDGTQACSLAQELRNAGHEKASCVEGGIDGWIAAFGRSLLWVP